MSDIFTSPSANRRHWKEGQTSWEEVAMTLALDPPAVAEEKDAAGGYVLGTLVQTERVHTPGSSPCLGYHRTAVGVVSRWAIALDIDKATPEHDTPGVLAGLGYLLAWHTTWRHTPDQPRYRVVLPLAREVNGREYRVLAQHLCELIGEEVMDATTTEHARFMYWPVVRSVDAPYDARLVGGDTLDPDEVLTRLVGSPTVEAASSSARREATDLPGLAGRFNRQWAGDLAGLITRYELPYEQDASGRFRYEGAQGAAGMEEIAPSLYFSHHESDPAAAGGHAITAYDLVRVHRYGHLDEGIPDNVPPPSRPSAKVWELDLGLEDVPADVPAEWETAAAPQPEAWGTRIAQAVRLVNAESSTAESGALTNTAQTRDAIREHDPILAELRLNTRMSKIEPDGALPWREHADYLTDDDLTMLTEHLQRTYRLALSDRDLRLLIVGASVPRAYDPVRDYLDGLEWDGVERLETCLPGVEDSPYTRLATRVCLLGAVKRTYEPGSTFDHVLMLQGGEGYRKTSFLRALAKGYDTNLGDLREKDTTIQAHQAWIVISDEAMSLRRQDQQLQKDWLTRTTDEVRAPYGRTSERRARRFIVVSSLNDPVFLADQAGNRRYLPVHVSRAATDDELAPERIDQIWAEAVHLYRSGARAWLNEEEQALARKGRDMFTEDDPLHWRIEDYLTGSYPASYEEWSMEERLRYLASGMPAPAGSVALERVCAQQIVQEVLLQSPEPPSLSQRTLIRSVAETLDAMPGWHRVTGRVRVPTYGRQRLVWEREPGVAALL